MSVHVRVGQRRKAQKALVKSFFVCSNTGADERRSKENIDCK